MGGLLRAGLVGNFLGEGLRQFLLWKFISGKEDGRGKKKELLPGSAFHLPEKAS